MSLFKRKPKVELWVCPRCSQVIPREAPECEMCGLDLREAPPRPEGSSPTGRPQEG